MIKGGEDKKEEEEWEKKAADDRREGGEKFQKEGRKTDSPKWQQGKKNSRKKLYLIY